ncbi:MAG: hypothetical protein K5981_09340 [Clostridia bacterium]|nr:hypothetical protein [Clostridia bacterium]
MLKDKVNAYVTFKLVDDPQIPSREKIAAIRMVADESLEYVDEAYVRKAFIWLCDYASHASKRGMNPDEKKRSGRMLSSPQYGWCTMSLLLADGRLMRKACSYVTYVPMELCECFIKYGEENHAMCEVDGESSGTAVLVLDNGVAYFCNDADIESVKSGEADIEKLKSTPQELARDLLYDLKGREGEWCQFQAIGPEDDIEKLKADLEYSVGKLEDYVNRAFSEKDDKDEKKSV